MSCLIAPSGFVARFVAIPPSITRAYSSIATAFYDNSPSEFMHVTGRLPTFLQPEAGRFLQRKTASANNSSPETNGIVPYRRRL
jgi:hypothetical protein